MYLLVSSLTLDLVFTSQQSSAYSSEQTAHPPSYLKQGVTYRGCVTYRPPLETSELIRPPEETMGDHPPKAVHSTKGPKGSSPGFMLRYHAGINAERDHQH